MNHLHQRPLTFTHSLHEAADQCLLRLADHTGAPLVMLVDVSGQLILYRGRLPKSKSIGLAALAAASFAAGAEVARFLGLTENFKQQLHEGKVASLYTSAVGSELLLVVAFTNKTVLGLVRLFSQRAQEELKPLVQAAITAREMQPEPVENVDEMFAKAVNDQLDELFSNEK